MPQAHYIIALVFGLVLGLLFYNVNSDLEGIQNRVGVLFFLIAVISLANLSVIHVMMQDRALVLRERQSALYSTTASFSAVLGVDVTLLRLLPVLAMAAVAYPLIGLHPAWGRFLVFCYFMLLVSLAAAFISAAVAAVAPSVGTGCLLATFFILINLLFAGFIVVRAGAGGEEGLVWHASLCSDCWTIHPPVLSHRIHTHLHLHCHLTHNHRHHPSPHVPPLTSRTS